MRSALREAARRGRESVGGGRAKPSPGRLDPRSSFLVPLGPRTTADVDLDQTTRGTEGCGQWHVHGKALPCLACRAGRSKPRGGRARAGDGLSATAGRDRDRGRAPPAAASRPPRNPAPAHRTQRGRLRIVWPPGPRAPLEVALLQVSCQRRGARAVNMRAPHRPGSPRTFPAFTAPPPTSLHNPNSTGQVAVRSSKRTSAGQWRWSLSAHGISPSSATRIPG